MRWLKDFCWGSGLKKWSQPLTAEFLLKGSVLILENHLCDRWGEIWELRGSKVKRLQSGETLGINRDLGEREPQVEENRGMVEQHRGQRHLTIGFLNVHFLSFTLHIIHLLHAHEGS